MKLFREEVAIALAGGGTIAPLHAQYPVSRRRLNPSLFINNMNERLTFLGNCET